MNLPIGTQKSAELARRRFVFSFLVVATIGLLAAWLMTLLVAAVSLPLAICMLSAFLIYAPGLVIWFWNALFGFVLLHWSDDPVGSVIPLVGRVHADDSIVALTAIVMTVRNGDPAPSFARLRAMQSALDACGYGPRFDYFVLSDSTLPEPIAAEERAYAAWRLNPSPLSRNFYRRRASNLGLKSGNLQDFCERWGSDYKFMVVLDADSLMTATAVMRLVRIMQANPRLGILQTLPVGLPTKSLFARIFQFGHSHSMRCFVLGGVWWHGDCCRPRGHNYAVRIAPFAEHCRMPELSGGKSNLQSRCEDAVEAAFMYRAGFEVRFLPDDDGSYESYPPTFLEFLERQNGWCHGDMQNLKILNFSRIAAMTRFHLLFVAQKYFGAAALLAFMLLAAAAAAGVFASARASFPAGSALALYLVLFAMYLAPRLFGIADAALRMRRRYGGLARLFTGSLIEMILSILLLPPSLFAAAISLLAQAFGRKLKWDEQQRESYQVSWRSASRQLAAPTALGLAILIWLAAENPAAIPWFLPFLSGLILAIPLAVVTSSAQLGAWAARRQFCALPDEIDSPAEINAIIGPLARAATAGDN